MFKSGKLYYFAKENKQLISYDILEILNNFIHVFIDAIFTKRILFK